MLRLFCILIWLGLFSPIALAGSLNTTEQQIRDDLTHQNAAQIELLQQLVRISSGTSNPQGVHKAGEIVRQKFEQIGFKTYWAEEPPTMHKAGTLIAERRGDKGKRLLLIGHLDTVYTQNTKSQQAMMTKGIGKGPGILDDKGGVVVIIYALQALQDAHLLDHASITVVLTGDEEDSGKPAYYSRRPLMEAAKDKDVALDFEPALTLNTAAIGRRGISQWTIQTIGNESHSATIFQKNVGAGAIFELARILNTMRTQLQHERNLSFNPGIILGGTQVTYDEATATGRAFGKQNVVAKTALAQGDVRYLTNEQKNAFEVKMLGLVKRHLADTGATITFVDGIPAMPPKPGNLALLSQYSEASVDLGYGIIKPLDPGIRGAGDISYIATTVPENLVGLGPVGFGTHSVAESIQLDTLPIQTQRVAILIYRLTR